jgi:cell division cycle 20-like protein 1 (cofactor of APC complex)
MIWSSYSNVPISKFNQHSAAVKALAWSPHTHGILASGGGSADRTIKFWNTLDGTMLDSIDTGSQVCNLMFSKTTKELVSTHGYSNNEIIVWKYPSL